MKRLLAMAALLVPAYSFGWSGTFTADSACSDSVGHWELLPIGVASIYASGDFGGGTLTLQFMLEDGETVKDVDDGLVFASDMTELTPIEMGADWSVCWELDGATAPDVDVVIRPYPSRRTNQ